MDAITQHDTILLCDEEFSVEDIDLDIDIDEDALAQYHWKLDGLRRWFKEQKNKRTKEQKNKRTKE